MSSKKVTLAARKKEDLKKNRGQAASRYRGRAQEAISPSGSATVFSQAQKRITKVLPDSIDLRDRPYTPAVQVVPTMELYPSVTVPVLDQGQTNACTGFALASVIFHLQHNAKRRDRVDGYAVSPYMLYSMARRYDEFPGQPGVDSGSSLRGAMKGWYKHGVCGARLWNGLDMPAETDPESDWWQDAVKRPLGAYYRVDHRSVTDMQIALNEIGILYASAACHAGWQPEDEKYPTEAAAITGSFPTKRRPLTMAATPSSSSVTPPKASSFKTPGRKPGAPKAWPSSPTRTGSRTPWTAGSLRLASPPNFTRRLPPPPPSVSSPEGKVRLAADETLRNREMDPFIIDMENNGILSNTGDFRTQPDDVASLVTTHLGIARKAWEPQGLRPRRHRHLRPRRPHLRGRRREDRSLLDQSALRPPDLPHLSHVGDRPVVHPQRQVRRPGAARGPHHRRSA